MKRRTGVPRRYIQVPEPPSLGPDVLDICATPGHAPCSLCPLQKQPGESRAELVARLKGLYVAGALSRVGGQR